GYSWDTIGDMSEVQNANMNDIREFYYNYYIPNNTILSICGDIDVAETKELVEKYFGEIDRGKDVVRPEFNEQPLNGELRKIIYDDIQFPGIFIGYRVPREFTKESVSLEILSEILAGGESSKLYRELVYDKQMSNEIASYVDNKESTGVFYIYSVLMPDIETGDVENIIDRIINDIGEGMLSDKEIEKAKNRIETKLTYKIQSILYKADLFAHFTCFYGNPGLINEILKEYLSVSKDDIIKTVNTYLKKENRVILTYLPKK
ncbi:MAG: M16 family metallopeptidase, partial [Ignavibacteria bacterium]